MRTAIVLFNRDLRVHDHPALDAATRRAEFVVPAFVLDDSILACGYGVPNRIAFLLDSLHDLSASLRSRGAGLVVRRGDIVAEARDLIAATGAEAVFVSADVSSYARRREAALERLCRSEGIGFERFPGVMVVDAGAVAPGGGDHYKVFGAYARAWAAAPRREVLRAPHRLRPPAGVRRGRLPAARSLVSGSTSPDLIRGGESEGRGRLARWLGRPLAGYEDRHDDLAADDTSRLSAFLHFGCLSPGEIEMRARERVGGGPFVRQLAWRDFFHQVLGARPSFPRADYRPRGDRWRRDGDDLRAWKDGRTGYPIVDAGMRQLHREGFMHNRARLITASFLVKDLYIDWRLGADHFFDLLVDGDVANNSGNWQWVAGTGNDTRPNRVFNPLRQAYRFDPSGDYVRRYVPELAHIEGKQVHEPWKLGGAVEYPPPLVDHAEAVTRFRQRRSEP